MDMAIMVLMDRAVMVVRFLRYVLMAEAICRVWDPRLVLSLNLQCRIWATASRTLHRVQCRPVRTVVPLFLRERITVRDVVIRSTDLPRRIRRLVVWEVFLRQLRNLR